MNRARCALAPSLAAGDVAHARKMTLASLQPQLRPQMAWCRCGGPMIKPACDGSSHARNGFRDAKDPNRVPDRRDHYAGQQIDLLDNRGTCQHAGYCTDRLSTVFHAHDEPFVTASGGDAIFEIHASCLGR